MPGPPESIPDQLTMKVGFDRWKWVDLACWHGGLGRPPSSREVTACVGNLHSCPIGPRPSVSVGAHYVDGAVRLGGDIAGRSGTVTPVDCGRVFAGADTRRRGQRGDTSVDDIVAPAAEFVRSPSG